MNHLLFKRFLLQVIIWFFCVSTCILAFASAQQIKVSTIQKKLAEIEAVSNGRIGVFAINTANNMQIEHRALERFPFCSTFKVMGVSTILKRSMGNSQLLQQKVTYTKKNLVVWSPITEKNVASGMTIGELCAAAMMYSDDTAINLLMKKLGGPAVVTAFARSIGDNTFRLDRWEPALSDAIPGDLRDTTTPKAMEKSLQRLVLGNTLALPQRQQLQTWLKENTTGNARIRAGVPKGWVVGDKTGTGDYGTTNDIGIIWPPKCSPIVVAIYFTQNKKDATPRDEIIAHAPIDERIYAD